MQGEIVYLIEAPFNQRDYKRFGIDIFVQGGFAVQVWDLTPVLNPVASKTIEPPDSFAPKYLSYFSRKSDLIAAINKEAKNTFFISLINYNIHSFSIFRELSKNKCPYALALSNANRSPAGNDHSKKSIGSLIKKAQNVTWRRLLNIVFKRIPLYLLSVKPATIVLAGGSKSIGNAPLIGPKTEILWVHTFDYDIFLDEPGCGEGEGSLIVFLDQYLPFHPDNIFARIPPVTSSEEYYPSLCRFFRCLEKEFDLDVVIAAHPRAQYEKKGDLFEGRKIVRSKTAELVRKGKLVVLHYSAAINFAVLYKKPMIFITTDRLEKSSAGRRLYQFASYFRKNPINIDRMTNYSFERELSVYADGYAKYKNDFIKVKGSVEIPQWQALCNKIRTLDV